MSPAAPPTVVTLGPPRGTTVRRVGVLALLIGGLIVVGLGVTVLAGASPVVLVGAVTGLALLVFGGGLVRSAGRMTRPDEVVVEESGVRRTANAGAPTWAVAWTEVSAVGLYRARHRSATRRLPMVGVRLFPADPSFAERHPTIARGVDRGDGSVRIPLTTVEDLVPALDAALRQHAGRRYRPPTDDGEISGLGLH